MKTTIQSPTPERGTPRAANQGTRPGFLRWRACIATVLRVLAPCSLLLAAADASATTVSLTQGTYTSGQPVVVDLGTISYYTFPDNPIGAPCLNNPDGSHRGRQDTPLADQLQTDLYVVPSGTVQAATVDLRAIAVGLGPRTAMTTGTSVPFLDLTIAQVATPNIVGPGYLAPGRYDVISDECQDGYFDPGIDTIVADFSVVVPGYPDVFSLPNVYFQSQPPAVGGQQSSSAEWTFHGGDEIGALLIGAPGGAGATANCWAVNTGGAFPAVGPFVSPAPTLTQFTGARVPSFHGVLVRPGATAGAGAALSFHPQRPGRLTSIVLWGEVLSNIGDGAQATIVLRTAGGTTRTIAPLNITPTPSSVRVIFDPPVNLCTCDSIAVRIVPGANNTGDDVNVSMTLGIAPPTSWMSPFTYDFNNLAIGSVDGQDGWYRGHPTWVPGQITAEGFDGSNVLKGVAIPSAQGVWRHLPHSFAYARGVQPVVWSLRVRATSGVAAAGLAAGPDDIVEFGFQTVSGVHRTALRRSPLGVTSGDPLVSGHWYEMQLSLDTNQTGGQATLRYRNLTLSETSFRTDSTIVNQPLGRSLLNDAYCFSSISARLDTASTTMLDDLSFADPSITAIITHPLPTTGCIGGGATFAVTASSLGPLTYRWQVEAELSGSNQWFDLSDGPLPESTATVSGSSSSTLMISNTDGASARRYRCVVINACTIATTNPATLTICVADTDDGSGGGTCDGGVTIDDLLYYLFIFEVGAIAADVDDGSSTGTPDGGVTIDDLLYYLVRFEAGC